MSLPQLANIMHDYESVSETHETGIEVFTRILEETSRSCGSCGFEDAVLGGEWAVHVERDPRSRRLLYRLDCPDCRSTETVDIDVG
jgi:hypothetical protein